MSATAKSELDTFLDTNHITDAEFKQFIEENDIDINEQVRKIRKLKEKEITKLF